MTTPAIRPSISEGRRNDTHVGTTDPKARLLRKGHGREAKPVFMGHALVENRHNPLMDVLISSAIGRAEHEAVPYSRTYAKDLTFNTVSVFVVKTWKVQIATPPVATKGSLGEPPHSGAGGACA